LVESSNKIQDRQHSYTKIGVGRALREWYVWAGKQIPIRKGGD